MKHLQLAVLAGLSLVAQNAWANCTTCTSTLPLTPEQIREELSLRCTVTSDDGHECNGAELEAQCAVDVLNHLWEEQRITELNFLVTIRPFEHRLAFRDGFEHALVELNIDEIKAHSFHEGYEAGIQDGHASCNGGGEGENGGGEEENGGNEETKVTICHIPPGNPDNAHTISVGESAVDAHVAHGDTLGACESDAGEKTPGSNSEKPGNNGKKEKSGKSKDRGASTHGARRNPRK